MQVVSSVTNILDDVQLWPEDEIQQNGVKLVYYNILGVLFTMYSYLMLYVTFSAWLSC